MPRPKPIPPLNAERADLAASYMPLARKLAARQSRRLPHLHDELTSEAILGLTLAAAAWEPKRCPCFATYAICRIRWRLKDALRAELPLGWRTTRRPDSPAPATFHLNLATVEERRGVPLRVPGRSPAEQLGDHDQVEASEAARAAIARAPRSMRVLLRRMYLDGLSLLEAGRACGLSPAAAMHRHAGAMAELRRLHGVADSTDGGSDVLEGGDDAGTEAV